MMLPSVQVCKDVIVACHALVPCGHVFCGPCISDWLLRQFNCPVCRCVRACMAESVGSSC